MSQPTGAVDEQHGPLHGAVVQLVVGAKTRNRSVCQDAVAVADKEEANRRLHRLRAEVERSGVKADRLSPRDQALDPRRGRADRPVLVHVGVGLGGRRNRVGHRDPAAKGSQ